MHDDGSEEYLFELGMDPPPQGGEKIHFEIPAASLVGVKGGLFGGVSSDGVALDLVPPMLLTYLITQADAEACLRTGSSLCLPVNTVLLTFSEQVTLAEPTGGAELGSGTIPGELGSGALGSGAIPAAVIPPPALPPLAPYDPDAAGSSSGEAGSGSGGWETDDATSSDRRRMEGGPQEAAAATSAATSAATAGATSDCERWSAAGECARNPDWMLASCIAACEALGYSRTDPAAVHTLRFG